MTQGPCWLPARVLPGSTTGCNILEKQLCHLARKEQGRQNPILYNVVSEEVPKLLNWWNNRQKGAELHQAHFKPLCNCCWQQACSYKRLLPLPTFRGSNFTKKGQNQGIKLRRSHGSRAGLFLHSNGCLHL